MNLPPFSEHATILPDVALLVPVYNGGEDWVRFIASCRVLSHIPAKILVIDSGSTDGSLEATHAAGFDVLHTTAAEFNHGRTRQWGMRVLADYPFVLCMTQDAYFATADALYQLRRAFQHPNIGIAYGRQLPHPNAGLLGAHARNFNYPAQSRLQTRASSHTEGIKAAFNSNTFSMYRQTFLQKVGGFPDQIILGEDAWVAGQMILAGHYVAYRADAKVYHSHDYTLRQEFARYFDIGVFHLHAAWLREQFGHAEGEGQRFVHSELRTVLRHAPWRLPEIAVRTLLKYLGYRLGLASARLPIWLCRRCSMHKAYWLNAHQARC